ncbi:MAG: hypothetical protein RL275_3231 [Chloroflexota bacterium]|jgi:Na+/H+ antiporter NhaD/arsenite permease-like protein
MILPVIIFVLAYIFIATEKFPRHYVALIGGGLLILFGILSPMEALNYINWETLGLLAGMFTLVSILEEAGFFKWLAMRALKKFDYHPVSLFVILIVFAAIMAMFVDSITVMLFLSALTLQLGRLLKLDPVPLVIAEVCAANTGGSATLVGDPPNVILGTTLGFNFADFATHTGPISLLASLLLLGMFYLTNRQALKNAHALLTDETVNEIEALHKEPLHAQLTRIGLVFFLIAVVLLVFHTPLSHVIGFHINAAMAALIPAGLAILFMQNNDRKKALLKVDSESILFFAGLFVLIGGLEKINLFEQIASGLSNWAHDHSMLVMVLHWVPGLASGIVDNVPLALAMSYVLKDLAQIPGAPELALMVWSLALGVNLGGNLTPIGASANVVAYSFMEKHHGSIGWKRWLTVAVPPTLAIMIFASLGILFKGQIGWF